MFALVTAGACAKLVLHARAPSTPAAAAATQAPPPFALLSSEPAPAQRADRALDRTGHSFCAGGSLYVLPDFASADGGYDLVIHFHGASDLVAQSYGAVKLDAIVVVFNLGVSAGVYEERLGYGPLFEEALSETQTILEKRGLVGPKLRRLALSAFSAGFGATERVLDKPGVMDRVDSLLLFDGIHTSYDDKHKMDMRPIAPFLKFAELAADGERLFYITHSNIPTLDYASTRETTDALLASVGLDRAKGGDTPAMPDLPAMGSAVAKKNLRPLIPVSHAEKNGLFVRGYAGDTPNDHLSHLIQMSATALPALAKRWSHD